MAFDVGASNASRMVGPTVGGLLLAGIGIEGAFLLSAVLYLAAIAATLAVRTRLAPSPGAGAVLGRTWEAVVIVFSDKRLAATMVVTVIYNVFAWPFTSMIPVIARDRLVLGPEGVGILTSFDGIGAFVGALALAMWLTPGWHARAYTGGVAVVPAGRDRASRSPRPRCWPPPRCSLPVSAARPSPPCRRRSSTSPPRTRCARACSVCCRCASAPARSASSCSAGWPTGSAPPEATAVTGGLGLLALAATQPLWRRI